MVKENISQKFRLKIIDETRNYFLEEIEQKEPRANSTKKFILASTNVWRTSAYGPILVETSRTIIGPK